MTERAIFLDRDDTLIEDPGYISDPDQVKLLGGVSEALSQLRSMGYKLVVTSNQSGVARGIVTEEVLCNIHERLEQLLAEQGAYLDKIFYCPYHPDGVIKKYRKESDLRKPNPGMLLKASEEMDVDLSESWVIGDSNRDIEAGLRAGCKTILIEPPSENVGLKENEIKTDFKAVNMREAVNIVKKHLHMESKETQEEVKIEKDEKEEEKPEPEISQESKEPVTKMTKPTIKSQNIDSQSQEELLRRILEQLKGIQRQEMFGEFSIMRFLAGMVQILVLFCLLLCVWLLMSPTQQDNSIFITLGFAMVLQMMSLTFYLIHGRK
ncbi:MAG: D-glycero-alpha-D-manno-heptose-1,7-bisphosphate 7-phosphatase [Planctomycetota bacterium]|jgi:D,D-heptose 1,7-bisphosphate phosphatase